MALLGLGARVEEEEGGRRERRLSLLSALFVLPLLSFSASGPGPSVRPSSEKKFFRASLMVSHSEKM